jgi:hypothetical protein
MTIMTTDLVGYFASLMVLLTFITKDMRLLRLLAIASNVAFIAYGMIARIPPVLCLHVLLLPVNAVRLYEMSRGDGHCAGLPRLRLAMLLHRRANSRSAS